MTEVEIREHYGIKPDAHLVAPAESLLRLAALLYSGWRTFELWPRFEPADFFKYPPALFFHLAIELCTQSKRGNFDYPAHIIFPPHK